MLSNSLQRKQKEEMELGQAVAARCHFGPPLGHWARGFLNERQTEQNFFSLGAIARQWALALVSSSFTRIFVVSRSHTTTH